MRSKKRLGLDLSRETLRTLTNLDQVHGGYQPPPTGEDTLPTNQSNRVTQCVSRTCPM